LAVDTSAYVTIETHRSLVVEFQGSLHFFALLAARNHECWVTANLEVDDLVVGVLNVPDNVEFVAGKAIGNGEVEVEWIVLESLLVVDEGVGETVAGLAHELEVNELTEAMARLGVFLVADAVGILPQSAYDREEERRSFPPVLGVAIPEIFITISILDALKFCSER